MEFKFEPKKSNLELFLEELAALKDKYGYEIDACGCCNSPWVVGDNGVVATNVYYEPSEKRYIYDLGDKT